VVVLSCFYFSKEEIKVGVDKAVKEVVDPIKTSVSYPFYFTQAFLPFLFIFFLVVPVTCGSL